jgi:hypothetical protein
MSAPGCQFPPLTADSVRRQLKELGPTDTDQWAEVHHQRPEPATLDAPAWSLSRNRPLSCPRRPANHSAGGTRGAGM